MAEPGDKLPHDITLRNVTILITCIIKHDDKFYSRLYLEEASMNTWMNVVKIMW